LRGLFGTNENPDVWMNSSGSVLPGYVHVTVNPLERLTLVDLSGVEKVKAETGPQVQAKTAEAREKNRRVEIGIVDTVIKYAGEPHQP
jgi:hypothetical protein